MSSGREPSVASGCRPNLRGVVSLDQRKSGSRPLCSRECRPNKPGATAAGMQGIICFRFLFRMLMLNETSLTHLCPIESNPSPRTLATNQTMNTTTSIFPHTHTPALLTIIIITTYLIPSKSPFRGRRAANRRLRQRYSMQSKKHSRVVLPRAGSRYERRQHRE